MGKQRIAQLLAQLKENQDQDLENSAAIFSVAQVAVNALKEDQSSSAPPLIPSPSLFPQPPVLTTITRADLLERYGSFNGCRKAAKQLGIHFQGTPSWSRLEAAFSYRETCEQLIKAYLKMHPNADLNGVSFIFDIP
jgi:hypothetical protein